ncbi:hypothetical protein ACIHAR_09260 [Streptomyces sp. NPDC052016]|uniref:hypothetical protein n=1 Tax=Streptomyces sp. NPDC052016 TaxID=3365680 RepID=UPI0037D75D3D
MTTPPHPPYRSHRDPPRRTPGAVVRRLLLSAALLAPLFVLVAALPSGARQPEPPRPFVSAAARAAGACPQTDFTEAVLCWGDAASRGERSIVVTLSAPQALRADNGLDAVADAVPQLRDKLIVIVADGVRTGDGGTFLLALASHRIVGVHSSISPLTAAEHRRLTELAGCPPDRFCDTVRTRARSGADLVDRGLAQDARTSLFTAGPTEAAVPPDAGDGADSGDPADQGARSTADTDDSSGDGLILLVVFAAVFVCLLATMVVMIRRTGAAAETPPEATVAAAGPDPGTRPTQHRSTNRHRGFRRSVSGTPAHPEPTHRTEPPHRADASPRTAPSPRTEPSQRTEPSPRTKPPAPPAAGPARPATARPTPQRTVPRPKATGPSATVRTALRPQGYVDIDGLLRRASWGGPGEPPPPGHPVDVVQGRTGELTVYAHGPADDGPHGDHAAPHA